LNSQLAGRVALVTGASSGIGEAAALALAQAGAHVAITARRADRLEGLAARISEAGSDPLILAGDIADQTFGGEIVERTAAKFGRLDILVNAAGVMPEGGVENADLAQWRHVMDVNVLACLATCRAALGPMLTQGSGDIINISSTSGRRAAGLFGIYSTSKHALNAMSEGLRQEVGGRGVRVCVIEPGATDTELWACITNANLRGTVQQLAQRDGSMKAEDIAEAILFVASLPPRANVSELLIRPTSDVAPL